MSRSMLCRTCKRPSAGEHASYCSQSSVALAALRETLRDTTPFYAFDANGGDAFPCPACGYQACKRDEACPRYKPPTAFQRTMARMQESVGRMFDDMLRESLRATPEPARQYAGLKSWVPGEEFGVARGTPSDEPSADDYATHVALAHEMAGVNSVARGITDADYARSLGWTMSTDRWHPEWEKGRLMVHMERGCLDPLPWALADADGDPTYHASLRAAVNEAERELRYQGTCERARKHRGSL